MYRIIGGDQKIYGPATAEQIRQWLSEGRLNAMSSVQPEGAAEWKPLSQIPEFAPAFSPVPPVCSVAEPVLPPFGGAVNVPIGSATVTNPVPTATSVAAPAPAPVVAPVSIPEPVIQLASTPVPAVTPQTPAAPVVSSTPVSPVAGTPSVAPGTGSAPQYAETAPTPAPNPVYTPPPFTAPPAPVKPLQSGPATTPCLPATNSAATTGFVFAILSLIPCCCFGHLFAIIGLIFSIIGLNRAQKLPDEKGKSLAIAGIVISIVGLVSGFMVPFITGLEPHLWFQHHWPHNSF